MRDIDLSRRSLVAVAPLAVLAARLPTPADAERSVFPDPVFQQIGRHQDLRLAISRTSGLDDDPVYVTACDDEEAAIQALGEAVPTTVAGAAALLRYVAEVEGDFADRQSPLVRTILTVSSALDGMSSGKDAA